MKCFMFLITMCIVGINAIPKPVIKGRIGGGQAPQDAPHACMVLVHNPTLPAGSVILGGGSIISPRRVLTAGHLVHGPSTLYQVGFLVGTTRRLVESDFALIHSDFNITDYHSDIALIFFNTNIFPPANVITPSNLPAQPAPPASAILVGFGFTNVNSTGASQNPYAAAQNIATQCTSDRFVAAPTHFCAIDETNRNTWVCPGDNGAGLYIAGATPDLNILVGIASRIIVGCNTTQLTAYTRVSTFATWIGNLL